MSSVCSSAVETLSHVDDALGGADDDSSRRAEQQTVVSSAIMLKIPTSRLFKLKSDFEAAGEGGVNIVQFLFAFVKQMRLRGRRDLLHTLPDLVDFFNLVDVNGDKHMEWSEFVMFVIEQVVQDNTISIFEKIDYKADLVLQPPSSRTNGTCAKFMRDFNKLFIGINNELLIYSPESTQPSWLHFDVKIAMKPRFGAGDEAETPGNLKGGKTEDVKLKMDVLDMCYLESKEILFLLRSDCRIDFYRFMSRSKLLPETIQNTGSFLLSQPCSKIQIRQLDKMNFKLFALGSKCSDILVWDINVLPGSRVELLEQEPLKKHDDIVRDILVIATDLYNIFVSCGMDGQVLIWDLVSLKYRASRGGFHSGVQALGFDGRNLLYAGGFDKTIIAWDLDAEIDRPLFTLCSHTSPILKIIPDGRVDRCVSLDTEGYIRFWDASKTSSADKEARLIHSAHCMEDHLRCIDIIPNLGNSYPDAVHNMMIVAQGRRSHTYKIGDYTTNESPPLKVLFSKNLLTVVTMHTRELVFWSSVTGDETKKISNVFSQQTEASVAVLDDRQRKIVVGNSDGDIIVYNCLTGVELKRFPTLPFSVRFLLYTPDKTVISLSGCGDLSIYDELPNDADADFFLRETRAHEVDVVAIAYSYKLGLIATADCTGTLKVWNYEYVQIDTIIDNLTGSNICQVAFIDPFPLLLVASACGTYTIIPVGALAKKVVGRRLWRLQTFVKMKEIVKYQKPKGWSVARGAVLMGAVKSNDGDGNSEGGASVDDSSSAADSMIRRAEPEKTYELQMIDEKDSSDESGEDKDKAVRPYGPRKMKQYLTRQREVKCMQILVRGDIDMTDVEEEDQVLSATKIYNKMVAEALRRKRIEDDIFTEEDEEEEDASDDGNDTANTYALPDVMPSFPKGVFVYVLSGCDDGTVNVADITQALEEIDIGPLPRDLFAAREPSYNPRRIFQRQIKDFEIDRTTWSVAEAAPLQSNELRARLMRVWPAARRAITTLSVVGDYEEIIVASEDSSVSLWTLQGENRGILTRGRKFDKLFKPKWRNPCDMKALLRRRQTLANALMDNLNFEIEEKDEDFYMDGEESTVKMPGDQSVDGRLSSVGSLSMDSLSMALERTEGGRILRQLAGAKNYDSSNRDMSAAIVQEKMALAMEGIKMIGKDAKKRRKRRGRHIKTEYLFNYENKDSSKASKNPYDSAAYVKDLLADGKKEHIASASSQRGNERGGRKRNIKTKYDVEIAQIDANDPNNWEISSTNRQRLMYYYLYKELDKAGITKDNMGVFMSKLNMLSPGNNFMDFVADVKAEQMKAKDAIVKGALCSGTEGNENDVGGNENGSHISLISMAKITETAQLLPGSTTTKKYDIGEHSITAKIPYSTSSLPNSPQLRKVNSDRGGKLGFALSMDQEINSPKKNKAKKLTEEEEAEESERLKNLQFIENAMSKFDARMAEILGKKKRRKRIKRVVSLNLDDSNTRIINPMSHSVSNPNLIPMVKSSSIEELLDAAVTLKTSQDNVNRKFKMTLQNKLLIDRERPFKDRKQRKIITPDTPVADKEASDAEKMRACFDLLAGGEDILCASAVRSLPLLHSRLSSQETFTFTEFTALLKR